MYRNKLELTGSDVNDILDGAVYLQIRSAFEPCVDFMMENVQGEDIYHLLSIFERHSIDYGICKVRAYMKTNALRIARECHASAISYDEIKSFLFGHKGFDDEDYLKSIMAKYDADHSGDLSVDQFKKLMFDLLK